MSNLLSLITLSAVIIVINSTFLKQTQFTIEQPSVNPTALNDVPFSPPTTVAIDVVPFSNTDSNVSLNSDVINKITNVNSFNTLGEENQNLRIINSTVKLESSAAIQGVNLTVVNSTIEGDGLNTIYFSNIDIENSKINGNDSMILYANNLELEKSRVAINNQGGFFSGNLNIEDSSLITNNNATFIVNNLGLNNSNVNFGSNAFASGDTLSLKKSNIDIGNNSRLQFNKLELEDSSINANQAILNITNFNLDKSTINALNNTLISASNLSADKSYINTNNASNIQVQGAYNNSIINTVINNVGVIPISGDTGYDNNTINNQTDIEVISIVPNYTVQRIFLSVPLTLEEIIQSNYNVNSKLVEATRLTYN